MVVHTWNPWLRQEDCKLEPTVLCSNTLSQKGKQKISKTWQQWLSCNSVNDRKPKLHITKGWLLRRVKYISLSLLKHRLNMKMKIKTDLSRFSNPVARKEQASVLNAWCHLWRPHTPTSHLEHFPAFKRSYPNIWRLSEAADGAPSAGVLANSTDILPW